MHSLKVVDYMNRHPVIDSERQLIGVISRSDVLRAIDLHLREGYSRR
jgi:predicted transcriptional regulator